MGIRDSFSRLKKKVKDKVSRKKHKQATTGADFGGGRVDQAGSLSGALPDIVAGNGLNQEDTGSDTDGRQAQSMDTAPTPDVPELVPPHRGDSDWEGEGGGMDEGQVSQRYSRPLSDVEITMGSGPGQEENGASGESGKPNGGT